MKASAMVTEVTCPDCSRVFDLWIEEDADEWFYGHDCVLLSSEDSDDVADGTCDLCGDLGATSFEQAGAWHTLCDDCEERTRPDE